MNYGILSIRKCLTYGKCYDIVLYCVESGKQRERECGDMANVGRKLGVNIFTIMQKSGISREELAKRLQCSYREVCRILEGKLMLPPRRIAEVASILGTTKHDLMNLQSDRAVPELEYMKEFTDLDNLDLILDLMDEYIDLKEATM